MREIDVHIAALYRQNFVVETVKTVLANPEVKTITVIANKHTDEEFENCRQGLLQANLITQIPIYLYRGDNAKGSNEKLRYIGKGTGKYISLVDNDLLLSPNHFAYLIEGCEKYNAYVSLHGMILGSRPLRTFYGDRQVFRGLKTVLHDQEVDIASNCGSLFRRDYFSQEMISGMYERVNDISMDDIWMAYFCKIIGVKRYVLKHDEGFMKHKIQYAEDDYVFDKHTKQLGVTDKAQTDFINNYWDND